MDRSLIGAAVFALLAGIAGVAVVAILRSATAQRPAAQFTPRPAPAKPSADLKPDRPCAVYEIDTIKPDGRPGKYIGYGFYPHQRIMQSHRKAKWWTRAVTAQQTLEPDRVDYYENEQVAHAEEVRRIRAADPRTLENKILYREGAA